jgi:potassium channel subfamily K member 13
LILLEEDYGAGDLAYRFFNVLIIVIGTSSLYSLFNVISIIIKHGLNYIIKKVDQQCCKYCCRQLYQVQTALMAYRRNAIIPGTQSISSPNVLTSINDGTYSPSGSDERRYSDEMIDVREFLQANKVSLAVMQKVTLITLFGQIISFDES